MLLSKCSNLAIAARQAIFIYDIFYALIQQCNDYRIFRNKGKGTSSQALFKYALVMGTSVWSKPGGNPAYSIHPFTPAYTA